MEEKGKAVKITTSTDQDGKEYPRQVERKAQRIRLPHSSRATRGVAGVNSRRVAAVCGQWDGNVGEAKPKSQITFHRAPTGQGGLPSYTNHPCCHRCR